MEYQTTFSSPIGDLILSSDGQALTGLHFVGQRYFAESPAIRLPQQELLLFQSVCRWLSDYFSGKKPDFLPPLAPKGTPFRREVWELLLQIPYGETRTYGELAEILAARHGQSRMSAQAIGGAVGHNPIGILIPCHRVVGAGGNLTGYAGGLNRKLFLLEREGLAADRFYRPAGHHFPG